MRAFSARCRGQTRHDMARRPDRSPLLLQLLRLLRLLRLWSCTVHTLLRARIEAIQERIRNMPLI